MSDRRIRHRWLVSVVALLMTAVAGIAAPVEVAPASAATTRPNIVVVMLDDATSQEIVHLPNIMAIAGAGTSFSSFYVATPECCPSRATLLTGQYPHNHGVLSGAAPTGGYNKLDHSNTLPVWLHDAGYHTAHVGKYMNGVGESDPLQRPAGWDRYAGLIDPSTYDYWRFKVNHDGVVEQRGTAAADYSTDVMAEMAVEDVASAPADKPLFLNFAPLAPHAGTVDGTGNRYPVPPPRYRRTFTGAQPSTPDIGEADVSDKPAYVQSRPPLTAANLANLQSWWRQSVEALRAVDDAVAAIATALSNAGRLDNTVFIITSDNGFLHGEHRISLGKVCPYEPSVRVPLILAGVGIPSGLTRSNLAVNVDLAPTIVALAGAEASVRRTMDGTSLLPALSNGAWGSGRSALIETGPLGGRLYYKAVRGPRWKYVEYTSGERELYDLITDPYELVNRANDPAVASVRTTMASRLARLATCRGTPCTTIV